MSNIFKLSFFNFKSIVKTRGFICSLVIAVLYIAMWIYLKPKDFTIKDYQFEFFRVINFILLYFSCVALGKEFEYGTAKILFTSTLSRTSIQIHKLLVILQIGLLYWLCSRIIDIVIKFRISKNLEISSFVNLNLLNSFVIFLIISFVIGSFCLMISIIVLNFNTSLVFAIGYFGVLQFFVPLFYGLSVKPSLTMMEKIITITPNYIIFYWVEFWSIKPNDIFVMVLWGCLFFITSLLFINKRNIK